MTGTILYFLVSVMALAASDDRCVYGQRRKGYATSCRNECPKPHPNLPPNVKDNTPCLKLNKIKTKPKDDAGLCENGKCVPYYDLAPCQKLLLLLQKTRVLVLRLLQKTHPVRCYGSCESIPCKDWPSCDFVIHGRHNEHDMGKCFNGSCIPIEAYESECDGKYRGYGYATSCKYICRQTKLTSNYKDGTPCLKLPPSKHSPGLCIDGKCTKYKRLGPRYPQPENEVFPYALRRCGDKTHSGKKSVDTCRHYCKQDGNWFFGFYESNTRCKRGRFKPRGYCCRGKCKKKVECWNERATLKEETKQKLHHF
ncbi:uncharacterized protein LOC144141283 isoform X2 [Haemaphysalis longicornis]